MARRRWTTQSPGDAGITVNTDELKQLAADFRAVGTRMHRVWLPEMVRAAAKPVESEAKLQARAHSQSIPPTIKLQVYGRGTMVAIKAGTKKVQLAALYELGNAGGQPGSFKHPVFPKRGSDRSTWHWSTQTGYPFLRPAVDRSGPEVDAAIGVIVDRMTRILARRASAYVGEVTSTI